MVRYNASQNQSVFDAADTLDDEARNMDRGAFFKSIHGTLSHLLWGDQIWMHRFSGSPTPAVSSIEASPDMTGDWVELKQQRAAMDQAISTWAQSLDTEWLKDNLTWFSGTAKRETSKPAGFLVMHFFNHQTHHRGQVHAMLTAAGTKPDDTDHFYMNTV